MEVGIEFLFKLLVGGVLGQMWWSKRQDRQKLDSTHDRTIRLEERHSSLVSDVHEIKGDTKEIKKILTALRVAQAQNK
ncbi:MAG: hypothetical protein Unbinned6805contig1000_2 [Prokaryotic dsDNA virus sp.]|nr:MAG: hypothetical protein Unbinned6805contig1000_2 [Prokaryotic dsDNA virus sp.]|tara:strand:+ start:13475 stop:13708 length:234 start_codon:yes stop_codon:yes gene_type:complete